MAGYRKVVDAFDKSKKHYYSFQLKSAKWLTLIIKGGESGVDPVEIKEDLEEKDFELKTVHITVQIPQRLYKVELMLSAKKLKKKARYTPSIKFVLYFTDGWLWRSPISGKR